VRRIFACALVLLVVGLITVELVGRFCFGLCDPPLLRADPELEYILQPNQQALQFGNRVAVNAYSMRAPDFPQKKTNPNEFRVMVLGDSVVYGGSRVDQDDLATARLQRSLADALHKPVIVGNVSAGSWGPPNLLAYVRRFGWFDADVVVIVVSQQDYDDAMTFEPIVGLDPSFPDRKPKLALNEIATRYLPRYLAISRQNAGGTPTAPPTTAPVKLENVAASMNALRDLVHAAKATGARVIVAQHWQVPEVQGNPYPEEAIIADVARLAGAEVVQLGPAMKQAADRGEQPYRDYIHPTADGQKVIATVLTDAILNLIRSPAP
jgi:hypothetical protein